VISALAPWLKPPRTLLVSLYLLTLASVSALAWFGWKLFEQEHLVESQRAKERMEQEADRLSVSLRGAVAEAAEKLGGTWGSPSSPATLPEIVNGGTLLLIQSNSITASPAGRLLFYPFPSQDPEAPAAVFAEPEMFEFALAQPGEALNSYERMASTSNNRAIRAGALLRKARVLRAMSRIDEARKTYTALSELQAVNVEGSPADLIGLLEVARLKNSQASAEQLRNHLAEGRWRLTRGQFAFYWTEAGKLAKRTDPPPEAPLSLAEITTQMWDGRNSDPRGQEIMWSGGRPYFLLWRGTAEKRAVLIAAPSAFVPQPTAATAGVHYALVDSQGRILAGERIGANQGAVRTAAESQLPWTLYVSTDPVSTNANLGGQRRFLLLGLAVMMLFLVLGTVFIARAIRRESELARMQSDFVSAVSHEFRSPLTAMRQLTEMLLLGRAPSEERRQLYYETMLKETTRLQRVVEALLQFGRLEAGTRKYHCDELDAATLVRRTVSDFEQQIAGSGRHVDLVEPGEPCLIDADAEALTVALRNLLDNAVKYSPHEQNVWVECHVSNRRVAIAVKDRGLGVADEEKEAIFGKFVRGSAATASNAKGSGVGLAMVRHIVAAHGGEITLTSRKGEGTTFTLWLPLANRA
jgi:signal transduction histidine kinase